jgi:hypothetical protein
MRISNWCDSCDSYGPTYQLPSVLRGGMFDLCLRCWPNDVQIPEEPRPDTHEDGPGPCEGCGQEAWLQSFRDVALYKDLTVYFQRSLCPDCLGSPTSA